MADTSHLPKLDPLWQVRTRLHRYTKKSYANKPPMEVFERIIEAFGYATVVFHEEKRAAPHLIFPHGTPQKQPGQPLENVMSPKYKQHDCVLCAGRHAGRCDPYKGSYKPRWQTLMLAGGMHEKHMRHFIDNCDNPHWTGVDKRTLTEEEERAETDKNFARFGITFLPPGTEQSPESARQLEHLRASLPSVIDALHDLAKLEIAELPRPHSDTRPESVDAVAPPGPTTSKPGTEARLAELKARLEALGFTTHHLCRIDRGLLRSCLPFPTDRAQFTLLQIQQERWLSDERLDGRTLLEFLDEVHTTLDEHAASITQRLLGWNRARRLAGYTREGLPPRSTVSRELGSRVAFFLPRLESECGPEPDIPPGVVGVEPWREVRRLIALGVHDKLLRLAKGRSGMGDVSLQAVETQWGWCVRDVWDHPEGQLAEDMHVNGHLDY